MSDPCDRHRRQLERLTTVDNNQATCVYLITSTCSGQRVGESASASMRPDKCQICDQNEWETRRRQRRQRRRQLICCHQDLYFSSPTLTNNSVGSTRQLKATSSAPSPRSLHSSISEPNLCAIACRAIRSREIGCSISQTCSYVASSLSQSTTSSWSPSVWSRASPNLAASLAAGDEEQESSCSLLCLGTHSSSFSLSDSTSASFTETGAPTSGKCHRLSDCVGSFERLRLVASSSAREKASECQVRRKRAETEKVSRMAAQTGGGLRARKLRHPWGEIETKKMGDGKWQASGSSRKKHQQREDSASKYPIGSRSGVCPAGNTRATAPSNEPTKVTHTTSDPLVRGGDTSTSACPSLSRVARSISLRALEKLEAGDTGGLAIDRCVNGQLEDMVFEVANRIEPLLANDDRHRSAATQADLNNIVAAPSSETRIMNSVTDTRNDQLQSQQNRKSEQQRERYSATKTNEEERRLGRTPNSGCRPNIEISAAGAANFATLTPTRISGESGKGSKQTVMKLNSADYRQPEGKSDFWSPRINKSKNNSCQLNQIAQSGPSLSATNWHSTGDLAVGNHLTGEQQFGATTGSSDSRLTSSRLRVEPAPSPSLDTGGKYKSQLLWFYLSEFLLVCNSQQQGGRRCLPSASGKRYPDYRRLRARVDSWASASDDDGDGDESSDSRRLEGDDNIDDEDGDSAKLSNTSARAGRAQSDSSQSEPRSANDDEDEGGGELEVPNLAENLADYAKRSGCVHCHCRYQLLMLVRNEQILNRLAIKIRTQGALNKLGPARADIPPAAGTYKHKEACQGGNKLAPTEGLSQGGSTAEFNQQSLSSGGSESGKNEFADECEEEVVDEGSLGEVDDNESDGADDDDLSGGGGTDDKELTSRTRSSQTPVGHSSTSSSSSAASSPEPRLERRSASKALACQVRSRRINKLVVASRSVEISRTAASASQSAASSLRAGSPFASRSEAGRQQTGGPEKQIPGSASSGHSLTQSANLMRTGSGGGLSQYPKQQAVAPTPSQLSRPAVDQQHPLQRQRRLALSAASRNKPPELDDYSADEENSFSVGGTCSGIGDFETQSSGAPASSSGSASGVGVVAGINPFASVFGSGKKLLGQQMNPSQQDQQHRTEALNFYRQQLNNPNLVQRRRHRPGPVVNKSSLSDMRQSTGRKHKRNSSHQSNSSRQVRSEVGSGETNSSTIQQAREQQQQNFNANPTTTELAHNNSTGSRNISLNPYQRTISYFAPESVALEIGSFECSSLDKQDFVR